MATYRRIVIRPATGMTQKDIDARLNRIGVALFKHWRSRTASLPAKFRVPYNQAMSVEVNPHRRSVILMLDPQGPSATLVRSIEYGFGPGGVGTQGPYDMRTTLLRATTRSIRHGRGGMYLNVPMRVTTRKIRQLGGYGAYMAAKKLDESVRSSPGTHWGGRLANPSTYAHKIYPKARRVRGIGWVPPHATDPLANLYRFRGKRGSTYGIFRTISQSGKPWIHPGIKARRFVRKVADSVPRIVSEVG